MALPRKNTRTIIVEGHRYRYRVTGDINWNGLIIQTDEGEGQALEVSFRVHTIVTPGLVRQIILDQVQQGWTPQERGAVREVDWVSDFYSSDEIGR